MLQSKISGIIQKVTKRGPSNARRMYITSSMHKFGAQSIYVQQKKLLSFMMLMDSKAYLILL